MQSNLFVDLLSKGVEVISSLMIYRITYNLFVGLSSTCLQKEVEIGM